MIWWKIGGVLALAAALFGAFKYIENIGYERCKTEQQAANLKAITEYAIRLKKAEEDRDAKQSIIDDLAAKSRSVRIHLPVCGNNPAPTNQNGGTGTLPNRVDEGFAELQSRAGELFKRCDELNLDAIRSNATHP